MTDVSVYYFTRTQPAGEKRLSKRRAKLEAISRIGEAVMESQFVVDHTEVNENGFIIGNPDEESHPMDALWTKIRSLERRAQSSDNEALRLDESSQQQGRDILRVKSRELRQQAQALRSRRFDLMTRELAPRLDSRVLPEPGGRVPPRVSCIEAVRRLRSYTSTRPRSARPMISAIQAIAVFGGLQVRSWLSRAQIILPID
jgi:hypothetical protein